MYATNFIIPVSQIFLILSNTIANTVLLLSVLCTKCMKWGHNGKVMSVCQHMVCRTETLLLSTLGTGNLWVTEKISI